MFFDTIMTESPSFISSLPLGIITLSSLMIAPTRILGFRDREIRGRSVTAEFSLIMNSDASTLSLMRI